MNIEPPSSRPREISVAEPITPAYERVKKMLFAPFDLAKWFTIGFCAWLAGLGESGGGFHGGYNGGNNYSSGSDAAEHFRNMWYHVRDFVTDNLFWILPLAVVLVTVLLCFWVLILWLNSRGKFMFLHCVAQDKAEVMEPWTQYASAGNSLFWFRLVVGLIGMVLMLPLVAMLLVTIGEMVLQGTADPGMVMTAVGFGLGLILIGLVFVLIRFFMGSFVVPIMYLRGGSCLAAWREFLRLLATHPGQIILYVLFRIVLEMVIGVLVVIAVVLTCCLAGCLLVLPYIGTVFLLPVLVFKRSYSLYYLSQYGPEYDVFPKPAAPPVATV